MGGFVLFCFFLATVFAISFFLFCRSKDNNAICYFNTVTNWPSSHILVFDLLLILIISFILSSLRSYMDVSRPLNIEVYSVGLVKAGACVLVGLSQTTTTFTVLKHLSSNENIRWMKLLPALLCSVVQDRNTIHERRGGNADAGTRNVMYKELVKCLLISTLTIMSSTVSYTIYAYFYYQFVTVS